MPTRAVYSVVQYLPDPGRAEAANAGVVLYVPSLKKLEIRATPTLGRAKKFFDLTKPQMEQVRLALDALKYRIGIAETEFTGEDDLARFAAARANSLRLTVPRLVMIDDMAADLDALYEKLVGEHKLPITASSKSRVLPDRLDEVFKRLVPSGKVWRPGKITIPTVERDFKVSAAFHNGVVNYIRGESLGRAEDFTKKLHQLGFNGQLIHKHGIAGEKAKLVVVSADPTSREGVESKFAESLPEFGVRFIRHAAAGAYAAEVEATAH